MRTQRSTDLGFLGALCLASALAAAPGHAGDVSVKLDGGAGFAVKDNTGAIERLRVDEATGNVSRNGALFVHTTGTNNTFVGVSAGSTSTSGIGGNSAFGVKALSSNTTGYLNSAVGYRALRYNATGGNNSAVGYGALRSNSTGNANSAVGAGALGFNTAGSNNSALGFSALRFNTGSNNSAVGFYALRNNTTGNRNAAVGYGALRDNTTGDANSASGANALGSNTSGAFNTAIGESALRENTTAISNSAVGSYALRFNTIGFSNSALGDSSLRANTTGNSNSAVGFFALSSNVTGGYNAAFGSQALTYNTTAGDNVAIGPFSLFYNTTGSFNVAIGSRAGLYQTTGYANIYLANAGVAGESKQIKIGTVGTHIGTTIAGISGATSAGGVGVLVNASGVLGTMTSSARFKEDVRDMGAASELLMKLRPVSFRYREEAVGAEESKTPQYGLIAEEVAEVAPELVASDLEGRPYSVKYHVLPALLLNELQETERMNGEQERRIETQDRVIAALQARLTELELRAHDGWCEEMTR